MGNIAALSLQCHYTHCRTHFADAPYSGGGGGRRRAEFTEHFSKSHFNFPSTIKQLGWAEQRLSDQQKRLSAVRSQTATMQKSMERSSQQRCQIQDCDLFCGKLCTLMHGINIRTKINSGRGGDVYWFIFNSVNVMGGAVGARRPIYSPQEGIKGEWH